LIPPFFPGVLQNLRNFPPIARPRYSSLRWSYFFWASAVFCFFGATLPRSAGNPTALLQLRVYLPVRCGPGFRNPAKDRRLAMIFSDCETFALAARFPPVGIYFLASLALTHTPFPLPCICPIYFLFPLLVFVCRRFISPFILTQKGEHFCPFCVASPFSELPFFQNLHGGGLFSCFTSNDPFYPSASLSFLLSFLLPDVVKPVPPAQTLDHYLDAFKSPLLQHRPALAQTSPPDSIFTDGQYKPPAPNFGDSFNIPSWLGTIAQLPQPSYMDYLSHSLDFAWALAALQSERFPHLAPSDRALCILEPLSNRSRTTE